jgi:tripartite-type tricarboxylate transporter receptor subunit TctC
MRRITRRARFGSSCRIRRGGATDITARAVAQELGKMWKQSVIVENRSGAIGVIGADYVATSAPDGYTLMLSTQNEVSINQSLSTLPYDPLVYAPAGTPDDIVRLLNRDFVKALHSEEVKESMRQQALDIGDNSQVDFQKCWVQ